MDYLILLLEIFESEYFYTWQNKEVPAKEKIYPQMPQKEASVMW